VLVIERSMCCLRLLRGCRCGVRCELSVTSRVLLDVRGMVLVFQSGMYNRWHRSFIVLVLDGERMVALMFRESSKRTSEAGHCNNTLRGSK
jgi:hypothetical protein